MCASICVVRCAPGGCHGSFQELSPSTASTGAQSLLLVLLRLLHVLHVFHGSFQELRPSLLASPGTLVSNKTNKCMAASTQELSPSLHRSSLLLGLSVTCVARVARVVACAHACRLLCVRPTRVKPSLPLPGGEAPGVGAVVRSLCNPAVYYIYY